MTTYEYQCDTCELSHTATFETDADGAEWAAEWAHAGYAVKKVN